VQSVLNSGILIQVECTSHDQWCKLQTRPVGCIIVVSQCEQGFTQECRLSAE